MKTKISTIAGLVLCTALLNLTGCTQAEEVTNPEVQADLAKVCVQVNNFTISFDDLPSTRAAVDPSTYADIGAITLAFYAGDEEVYKTTQLKSEALSFGQFSLSLPMGSYKMVVLGYDYFGSDAMVLTSATAAEFTSDHVRETFCYTQDVSITSTAAVSLSATLSRIVSELKIVSTDNKSANASTVMTTFLAGGKAFNPSTGLALADTGFSNIVGASQKVGAPTTSTNFLFLTSDEQTIDITIDVLDAAGNSISQRVVPDVPLKRNRITTLRGSLYTSGTTAAFQLETSWLPGHEQNF